MRHAILVLLLVAACGDDKVTSDTSLPTDASAPETGDTTSDDTADTPPPDDATPAACEAELTEVDHTFVEIVTRGPCAGWSFEVRDAAVFECSLVASFAVEGGRQTGVLTVPPTALIVIREPNGVAAHSWTLGTCAPDQGCVSFASQPESCLPADTEDGSVSLCGSRWLDGRSPTPRATNDCECRVDCGEAAGQCQNGACVDGSCRFEPKSDGTGCADESLCTSADHCEAGVCVGTAVVCGAPPGPCAKGGVCVPQTGQCIFPDICGDHASCTAAGCACADGFEGDGLVCNDIDECLDDPCEAGATCVNFAGTFQCTCPPGTTGPGCTASSCDCGWEDPGTCGAETSSLTVRVTDLWGQPLGDGTVLIENDAGALLGYSFEGEVSIPLCGAFFGRVEADAPIHASFVGTLRWDGSELTLQADRGPDQAWALSRDAGGFILSIGLAHDWFAASGRPARYGNRLAFYMDGEAAWRGVHDAIVGAQSLITGTSWWWTSEVEIVRDRASDPFLTEGERWLNTILGTLEQQVGVDRKILVNQFLSQDGLFSGLTVDSELTAKGEVASDRFDYLGQANAIAGEFTVNLPAIDYGARVAAASDLGTSVDAADAEPFMPPIAVDMTEIPLGLSAFDLPLASWHQKFWTIDQKVAFIGGMNAKVTDWDTNEHRVFEPLRMNFGADKDARDAVAAKEKEPDQVPRKDYMVRIDGPSAADAVDVFHERWEAVRASGVDYAENATGFTPVAAPPAWPDGVQAQVIATMPPPFDEYAILETLLRAISNARDYIYIEDQYFRAPILYDAVVARMAAMPDLVLIVATNVVSEWTDPGCWQTAIAYERFKVLYPDRFRIYYTQTYDVVRTDCTFCIDETEAHFVPINLHSKLVMIDDEYLEVGSCNSNNRGLLYEGELAVAVHDGPFVSAQRKRVFENLLGPGYSGDMPPSDIIQAFDEVALKNQAALDAWDDEGMDLDLDGDAIPTGWTPKGFLYPLVMDAPDDCLIEDIGPDVT